MRLLSRSHQQEALAGKGRGRCAGIRTVHAQRAGPVPLGRS